MRKRLTDGVNHFRFHFHDRAVLLVHPESAFESAKQLGGAGSGLVSLVRHCLEDEAATAIQPTFSEQPE